MVALSGCSHPEPRSQAPDLRTAWSQQLDWVQGLQTWQASGRVAVRSADDGGSASMHWQQTPTDFSIRLHGPFGQGAVRIKGNSKAVSLRRSDGEEKRAASAEELLFGEFGWSMPVSVLRYWMLGRPAPAYPIKQLLLNEAGLLEYLIQAGWQVTYQNYREAGEGVLPGKFELRRDNLRVRVVVSQWQLPG